MIGPDLRGTYARARAARDASLGLRQRSHSLRERSAAILESCEVLFERSRRLIHTAGRTGKMSGLGEFYPELPQSIGPELVSLVDELHARLGHGELRGLPPIDVGLGGALPAELAVRITLADIDHWAFVERNTGRTMSDERRASLLWCMSRLKRDLDADSGWPLESGH